MLYWLRGEKLLVVVHYFLRILQKLSNILFLADKIEQLKSVFFCKRKIIHENIWANYFSPLTLSWSVSMKITGDSLYYSSMSLSWKFQSIRDNTFVTCREFCSFYFFQDWPVSEPQYKCSNVGTEYNDNPVNNHQAGQKTQE